MHSYQYYKNIFKGRPMPFAFVDLDFLEENARQIAIRAGEKKIRIASKSIRCIPVLKKIVEFNKIFQGIMCYALPEAVFLSKHGFDDILMGYPAMQEKYIAEACEEIQKGKKITLMVDCIAHAQKINDIAANFNISISICLDLDMSSSFPLLYFGVHRSPLKNKKQVSALVDKISHLKNVEIVGLMGYEAQIAGLGDNYPSQVFNNAVVKLLKKKSVLEISERRKEVVHAIESKGIKLRFINGGGTGSLETTREENCITEMCAGSGFFSSSLFDNYSAFKHLPAAAFAIEIVRKPEENMFTCHGGGYIASGSIGTDKQPLPYLPSKMKLNKNEGAGEVQTPLIYCGDEKLSIGDPVFLRHSKAGELCERFNFLYLLSQGKIVDEVKTYRGEGMCFL